MSANLSVKKIRVLVLEDNPAEAEINVRELRRAGFDPEWLCVETESDFLAALSPPPDLILSDYSMPQFDGMRAVALLRERKLDTPFILISGTMGEEVAVKSIKEGADDFLLKDRLSRLGPAVAGALQTKRLRDERRLADERTHQSVQQQIAILNALPAHIALLDPHGVILAVNEAWRRFATANVLQGPDFTLGQNYLDVCERAHGECSEEARDASLGIRRVLNGELAEFVIEYPCHSPTEQRWFRLMVTPLSESERAGAVVMHVNITERKRAEVRIQYLNRVYSVLSDINQNIVREKDPEKMLAEACRIAVEKGRFLMAWIGLQDPGASTMRLAAHAGEAGDYLEKLKSDLATDIAMHRPTSEAMGSGIHVSVNDIANDPRKIAWRESALPLGFRASVALPIKVDGHAVGTFNLYACETSFFTEEELSLLDELAFDIGFALEVDRREEERRRAEEALQASEVRYRRLFEASKDGILILDAETGTIVDVNPFLFTLLGYTHDELLGKQLWEIGCFKDIITNQDAFRKLQREQYIRYENLPVQTKEGRSIWVEFISNVYGVGGTRVVQCNVRDITERKRVEAELREREALLASAQVIGGMGSWNIDVKSGRMVWSDSTCKLFGIAPGEFRGTFEHFYSFIILEDRPSYDAAHRGITPQKPYLEAEYRIRQPDWQVRWMFERGIVEYDADGKQVRRLGMVMDISERKRTQEALAESEKRYRDLVESSHDLIWSVDAEGRITYLNPACRSIYGREPEEMIGRIFLDFVPPEQYQLDLAVFAEALRSGKETVDYISRVYRKDGSVVTLSANARILRDPSGRVIGSSGISRDMTESMKAQDAVRESETRFRALFEQAAVGMSVKSIGGRFHRNNRRFCEIIGYTENELLSLGGVDVTHPDDWAREEKILAHMLAGELQTSNWEKRYIRKDGGIVWCNFTLSMLPGSPPRFVSVIQDISERKQATEERDRLFNHSLDMLCVASFDNRLEQVNPAWTASLGWSAEELTSRPWMEFVHPQDHAATVAAAGQIMQGVPLRDFENRYICKDGGYRWMSWSCHPLLASRQIFAVVRDVTERRQRDEQLRLLETCISRLNDIVLITEAEPIDEPGPRILYVNDAFVRRTGFSREEALAATPRILQGPRTQREALDRIRIALKAWKPIREELINYTKSGEEFWIELDIVPVADATGWYTHWIAIERDITERKRVEASHSRLATAVEQASETIVITDTQGHIVYANPAFEKNTGYARAEALGKNPRILKSGKHDVAFYRDMWATIKRGEAWHGRMINKRKDGSQFEEDATISPVRDASGTIVNYVAVKRDVTREIQLEAQFRQSQKMEAFGLLAGGVAHDFNNLMSVVMGYSELWLMKLPPDAPIRGPLTAIRTAGERAADLTKQLLAFSRQTILEPKILDLNTVVREMEKMLKRLIGEDIHFTSILNPKIPRVRIDPGQLGQVLMNLSVNARDAMPRGGSLTIETRTTDFDESYVKEHLGATLGRQIVLSVRDTGTGMPPEIVTRIFEPFFTTKEVGKGTGLGLAVVYGVVTQSGGMIQVDSKVGVGTTFTLYFPATLDEVLPDGRSSQILEYGGIETILVVEDEESLCEIAVETLKSFGYTVLKAHSGPDALKLVSAHGGTIDLILTDVVMPKMSGRELVESLKQKLPTLKVIFMSGYTDDSVVRHGVHHEKVPFLQKPFAPFDLLKKVREELDKH